MADDYPGVEDVRAWLKLGPDTADDLAVVLAAEIDNQRKMCRVPDSEPEPVPDSLYQAILRRCSRAWAARAAALGLVGGGQEYGPARLSAFDAEIERYERPYRRVVV